MNNKSVTLVYILISTTILLFGCSNKNEELNSNNPVTITMWHNFGGSLQNSMDSLIDEFNNTIGKEEGIIVNVTAISSGKELQNKLNMIANGDLGAPDSTRKEYISEINEENKKKILNDAKKDFIFSQGKSMSK